MAAILVEGGEVHDGDAVEGEEDEIIFREYIARSNGLASALGSIPVTITLATNNHDRPPAA